MTALRFLPLHEFAACGQVFPAGETAEVKRPTADLRRAVAAAAAAGALVDVKGEDSTHVQSQETAEAAYAAAQADGSWRFGHELQQRLSRADALVSRAQAAVDEADTDAWQREVTEWTDRKVEAEIEGNTPAAASCGEELERAQAALEQAQTIDDDERELRAGRLEAANGNRERVDGELQTKFAESSE